LAEKQAQGLYSFNRRDLSVELEELHERVAEVESERTIEAVQLSWLVMEIVFPIWDIPVYPKSAQDVLTTASLVLERQHEEHASPWV
jgi:hypothetical protein